MKTIRNLFAVAALALASFLAPATASAQALSDWVENNFIDQVFRAQTWTIDANLTVGLSTAACSDSSIGTEVSGGSYARVSIARSTTNWANTQNSGTGASTGTGGQTSNSVAINFTTPTAGWGTVTHFFIMSSTNIVLCQALTTSKTINSGDTVSFPIASLTFTIQ